MVQAIVGAWACWCLFNLALLLAAPYFGLTAGVFTNGFVTVFPDEVRDQLTQEEQAAVLAHERGHIAHRHALKNLARACFLMPRSDREAFRQELEADDHAAARGHGQALASALRKLSVSNRDLYRARRLSAA